jgi:hypothetical protein
VGHYLLLSSWGREYLEQALGLASSTRQNQLRHVAVFLEVRLLAPVAAF